MKWLYLYITIVLMTACQLDRELDIQYIDSSEEYFIECYTQPDSLFNLSATQVSPIFEDFILDYSLDFDVFIIDQDTIELFQSLFIEEGTGYIYNFGSGQRLSSETQDLRLLVISPSRDTITAFTQIPPAITLEECYWIENQITASFYSSSISAYNFYILIINYQSNDPNIPDEELNEIQYLDYHHLDQEQLIQTYIATASNPDLHTAEVTLMRVTEENFRYQKSLQDAKNASKDNVTFPSPLEGNIQGGLGIFTSYTQEKSKITR